MTRRLPDLDACTAAIAVPDDECGACAICRPSSLIDPAPGGWNVFAEMVSDGEDATGAPPSRASVAPRGRQLGVRFSLPSGRGTRAVTRCDEGAVGGDDEQVHGSFAPEGSCERRSSRRRATRPARQRIPLPSRDVAQTAAACRSDPEPSVPADEGKVPPVRRPGKARVPVDPKPRHASSVGSDGVEARVGGEDDLAARGRRRPPEQADDSAADPLQVHDRRCRRPSESLSPPWTARRNAIRLPSGDHEGRKLLPRSEPGETWRTPPPTLLRYHQRLVPQRRAIPSIGDPPRVRRPGGSVTATGKPPLTAPVCVHHPQFRTDRRALHEHRGAG